MKNMLYLLLVHVISSCSPDVVVPSTMALANETCKENEGLKKLKLESLINYGWIECKNGALFRLNNNKIYVEKY